ncbi:MAG: hypothetical protein IKD34_07365, partial [Oscillospiraceae bacterium]|nr:hypothetical protein [Oscillospiraceae bacterium]
PDNETAMGIFSLEMGKTTFGGKSLKKKIEDAVFYEKQRPFLLQTVFLWGNILPFHLFHIVFHRAVKRRFFPLVPVDFWGKPGLFPIRTPFFRWKIGWKSGNPGKKNRRQRACVKEK